MMWQEKKQGLSHDPLLQEYVTHSESQYLL